MISCEILPAASDGALNIALEYIKGWVIAPYVSPLGPFCAHIVWSRGWYILKQKPSFLDGLSINFAEFKTIVPTQWPLCKTTKFSP